MDQQPALSKPIETVRTATKQETKVKNPKRFKQEKRFKQGKRLIATLFMWKICKQ